MHSFRSATGVFVISTALLVGSAGGAISAADTGTNDSTSGSSTSNGSTAAESASNSSSENSAGASSSSAALTDTSGTDISASLSADEDALIEALAADTGIEAGVEADVVGTTADAVPTESDPESVVGVASAAVSSEQTGDQPTSTVPSTASEPVVVESETVQPVASVAESGSSEAATVAASSTAAVVAATPTATSTATPTATVTSTRTDSGKSTAGGTGTPQGPSIQVISTVEPDSTSATQPPTLEEVLETLTVGMVGTMTTVVVTLGNTVATVAISLGSAAAAISPTIMALPASPTPMSDLVALVEMIWDSVAESATAVMMFPANLAVNLGMSKPGTIGDGVGPALIGDTNDHRRGFAVADGSPMLPMPEQSPLSQPMAPVYYVDDAVGPSVFAAGSPTALAALAAPTQIVPTSIPTLAGDYESLFDRAFGALLVPLSLWALATGALPGLMGLLVVFGAGARVGYRQAKAGLALRVAGIARFAGSGPLGVVRSGSFVALHQRGVRAGRAPIARWSRLGDQAA